MPIASSPKSASSGRILIVDDHPIVREHLAALINDHKGLKVVGQAEDADSAMRAVAALKPNLVIVDLGLKGRSGLELIKEIQERFLGLPMLVLSMHEEQHYADRALKAGAKGYITKREATGKIIPAIRVVLSGQTYLSDAMSAQALKVLMRGAKTQAMATSLLQKLTDREMAVFQLIGEGHTTREVAHTLGIEIKTVETYRARIREKLQLDSGTALVHHAIRASSVDK